MAMAMLIEACGGMALALYFWSAVEREALFAATASIDDSRTVSVKFVDRPSLAQLCVQINLVKQEKTWSYLCSPESDLDLILTIVNS